MKPGLRILITNNALDNRAGSELYVRDVATSLLARGHSPVIYSPTLGEVAAELRAATIPVIDDLCSMSVSPDIIHGHHHLETMTALLHFSDTPAVSFCHGWLPWQEAPPKFPRIFRYIAVDHVCRGRLIYEHGISEDRVHVVLNFVDLARFKPRAPLPARPERALIFSNNANEGTYAGILREECRRAGIEVEVGGLSAGNILTRPESVLGDYDLVFAKGRAALESMAVGAAVVLCDSAGVGPMIKSGDLERLRSMNFGVRTLREPISSAAIALRIAEYDAGDAAEVSRRIRETAGSEEAIDRIEEIYREVIAEFHSTPKSDPAVEAQAASNYLRWLSPLLKDQTAIAMNWVEAHREQPAVIAQSAPEIVEQPAVIVEQSAVIEKEAEASNDAPVPRHSLGFRMLDRYGPIKYRYVLPAYNRVRKLLGYSGS